MLVARKQLVILSLTLCWSFHSICIVTHMHPVYEPGFLVYIVTNSIIIHSYSYARKKNIFSTSSEADAWTSAEPSLLIKFKFQLHVLQIHKIWCSWVTRSFQTRIALTAPHAAARYAFVQVSSHQGTCKLLLIDHDGSTYTWSIDRF